MGWSIIMFNAKYDNPLDDFTRNNLAFSRTDLENVLSGLGIYTGKTPDRSINRDVIKYLRKNFPEFEKLTTKEVKETKDKPVKKTGGGVDTGVWYKKLLKTGTTKSTKWETSTKVEIFTYEQNDKCRYLSLMEAALKEMDYTEEIAETGYSSSRDSAGEFSPYQFESAFLKIESVKGGYTSFEEAVTLEDTNETPC